jgi:8-oxo-dGTP diphosphatase
MEKPSVGVELVVFTVIDSDLKVLLIKRREQPFKGVWSLPGGLVQVRNSGDQGENIDDAAHRVLFETTGIIPSTCTVEQLCAFGKAGRDPRTRLISIAWTALVSPDQLPRQPHPLDNDIQWFSANEEIPWMRLSFDHAEILDTAVHRIRSQLDTTNIAFHLVAKTFTVAELRDTHEAIKSHHYDARNFRRRFQRLVEDGVVIESPGKRHRGKARPAKVWRFSD